MARDDEHLSRLTSVRTEMEAGVIVGGLEARGIQAVMSGVYTANFRAEAPGWVEVLVAERDLPRAQQALDEVQSNVGGVDWSQVDVGEPEDPPASGELPRWMSLSLWRSCAFFLITFYVFWLLIGLA
jgi:Putative prokaryotic signal transducing protein